MRPRPIAVGFGSGPVEYDPCRRCRRRVGNVATDAVD
jgi:hypothetical protein